MTERGTEGVDSNSKFIFLLFFFAERSKVHGIYSDTILVRIRVKTFCLVTSIDVFFIVLVAEGN